MFDVNEALNLYRHVRSIGEPHEQADAQGSLLKWTANVHVMYIMDYALWICVSKVRSLPFFWCNVCSIYTVYRVHLV